MLSELLRRWLSNPEEDVRIENVAAHLAFNHRTRTVFMFCYDPGTPAGAYDALEAWLKSKGYFLQIFQPSVSVPRPPTEDDE